MEFKVGDTVRIIKATTKSPWTTEEKTKHIGKTFVINRINEGMVYHNGQSVGTYTYHPEELELVTETTMTPKEALHAVIDGKTVVHADGKGGYKIYMEDNVIYFEGDVDQKQPLREHLRIYSDSQWKVYVPETPPRFTVNSLVYNSDGTIGKVVEDKGVSKGVRKYSVRFNAVRDSLRSVEESQLTEYKL